jgi:hypothetical protein
MAPRLICYNRSAWRGFDPPDEIVAQDWQTAFVMQATVMTTVVALMCLVLRNYPHEALVGFRGILLLETLIFQGS